MCADGCGNGDRIDIVTCEQLVVVGVYRVDLKFAAETFQLVGARIGQSDQLGTWQLD